MPYEGEMAGKTSHFDFVKNADIQSFLGEATYLKMPDETEIDDLKASFVPPVLAGENEMPIHIFAADGSHHESFFDRRLPSTRIGYVKISAIYISLKDYTDLKAFGRRFVDPFKVAKLQRHKDSLAFALPGSNVIWRGHQSVRDSFRARVDYELIKEGTRFVKGDYRTSLRSTLFYLASLSPERRVPGHRDRMLLHKCPSCPTRDIEVRDVQERQFCPNPECEQEIFPSDALRLWEEVSDFQSITTAMTRFMLAVEHMLPVHYLRHLISKNVSYEQLGSMAFFVDGPLAVFGNSAWLFRPLMTFYYNLNSELREAGCREVTVIGLQKTGQLADYFNLVERHIPSGALLPVADHYRYKYIVPRRGPSRRGFGDETYYGQDFLYKTERGRCFIIATPYPFPHKGDVGNRNFHEAKVDMKYYSNLFRVLRTISHFESDLYKNAVVPIALAHRYTAISAVPGGQVLDILSREMFSGAGD